MQYYEVDHFVNNQDTLSVLGDQCFREVLGDNIYIIPKDILDDVLSNCVFLMLTEKAPAGFIPKKLIEGKNICAFYEILYSEKKTRDDQVHMILHEIAHYVLGHADEGLSDEDYYNQEKEANRLVDKWIDDWEKYLKAKGEDGDRFPERG